VPENHHVSKKLHANKTHVVIILLLLQMYMDCCDAVDIPLIFLKCTSRGIQKSIINNDNCGVSYRTVPAASCTAVTQFCVWQLANVSYKLYRQPLSDIMHNCISNLISSQLRYEPKFYCVVSQYLNYSSVQKKLLAILSLWIVDND
jgi:hypothetical protein